MGVGTPPRAHGGWRVALWVMLGAPVVFIIAFAMRYGYQPIIVALHLAEVALAAVILGIVMRSVGSSRLARRHPAAARIIVTLLGATTLSFYWLVVVLSTITNEAWGWSISINLARAYVPVVPPIVANLPVSRGLVFLAIGAGGCLIVAFYCVWWIAAPRVIASMQAPPRFPTTSRIATVASVLVLGTFIVRARQAPFAGAEPFTAFFTAPGERNMEQARADNVRARHAYVTGPIANPRNVILIFSDALRADHMGVYGYSRATTPFLSHLDSAGALRKVKLAMATCPYTACGVMSTLTSRDSAVLDLGALTIEDVLHDRGYRTNFIGASDHTVWDELRFRYGDNVDYFFDGWRSKRYSLNDDRLVFEGLEGVAPSDGRPAFFFFFFTSTHVVGTKLPEFRRWTPAEVGVSAGGAQPRINAYDNGILQADHSIQELFSKLDAKGYLQNSIVMILGDHGDAFGEHGIFGHTLSVYQETMHIPLLIYDTDTAARYPNLDFATQSDIAPTILGRLGLPKPADWQGVSLISQPPQTFSTYWTDRARPWHAVLYRSNDRIYKYMYVVRWGSRAEELYELSSDPGEKTNLIAQAGLSSVLAAVRGRAAARWPIDFQ